MRVHSAFRSMVKHGNYYLRWSICRRGSARGEHLLVVAALRKSRTLKTMLDITQPRPTSINACAAELIGTAVFVAPSRLHAAAVAAAVAAAAAVVVVISDDIRTILTPLPALYAGLHRRCQQDVTTLQYHSCCELPISTYYLIIIIILIIFRFIDRWWFSKFIWYSHFFFFQIF